MSEQLTPSDLSRYRRVISTWMEAKPADHPGAGDGETTLRWKANTYVVDQDENEVKFTPAVLDLDRLHLVEERLSADQRHLYCLIMFQECCVEARTLNPIEDQLTKNRWPLIHASADQKTAALGRVLESEVKGETNA